MHTSTSNIHGDDENRTWRPLHLLNLYRILLSGAFLMIAVTEPAALTIGKQNPQIFFYAAHGYFFISILSIISIRRRKPNFTTQVYLQAIADIIAITLIVHASGGVKSGLGMLLIIAVAGGSLLLAGQTALRLAASATLLMLSEHIYTQLTRPLEPAAYTHAGLLGAAFFATAILGHALAKRVRASEELAYSRAQDLAKMQHLTEYVLQSMETGVAVIDRRHRLWLVNESGRDLLGLPQYKEPPLLSDACPQLDAQYCQWLAAPHYRSERFRSGGGTEILPRMARLESDGSTIIFLEDSSAVTRHAHQLKLASLGRLAGSIAHEIRNPLGAISHAGQLLAESPNLDKADLRLTEIIRSNSERTNDIIENTLQLGRRKEPLQEEIQLKPWLERFVEEFCQNQQIDTEYVTLEITTDDITILFDPSQLHQIIWNLCHNGIRHSQTHTGKPKLALRVGISLEKRSRPYLDIIDYGPGIAMGDEEQIFEPFYTTESKGTGLGLYIARELSECNNGNLTYQVTGGDAGACFRLSFSSNVQRSNK